MEIADYIRYSEGDFPKRSLNFLENSFFSKPSGIIFNVFARLIIGTDFPVDLIDQLSKYQFDLSIIEAIGKKRGFY